MTRLVSEFGSLGDWSPREGGGLPSKTSGITRRRRPFERGWVGGTLTPTHAHTGNGGCVDIDTVRFEPGPRGLHHAAANQIGLDHDLLWHGMPHH